MLGHDHALSGALAFVAVAPLLPVSGTQLAVAATLTAGAEILPDLDEPGSTIARTFGFLTGAFAWIVHRLSGGHRKGTHSLLGLGLLTLAALWAGSWQRSAAASLQHGSCGGTWSGRAHHGPAVLGRAPRPVHRRASRRPVRHRAGRPGPLEGLGPGGGDPVARAGPGRVRRPRHARPRGRDITHDGCPLLYPVSRYEFGLLPEPIRITTNKLAERWVISPLLLAGPAHSIYRAAAPALTTAASGG